MAIEKKPQEYLIALFVGAIAEKGASNFLKVRKRVIVLPAPAFL